MSVNDQDGRDDAVGNGATTAFTYTFKIFTKNDIQVLVDGTAKVVDTDYTVSGVGASGGGTVTFTTAPANGALVTLLRLQPFEQTSVYVANEAFPSARVEKDYDKLAMQVQQLREQVTRALTLAPKEAGTVAKTVLPSATGRASQYLYFDASGNPTTVATVIPAGTPASAFMATVLDDVDAATARATLGAAAAAVTLTNHGVLIGQGTSPIVATAAGTAGQVLTSNGASSDPTFQAMLPTGSILDHAGLNTPVGFLLCDGSAVSRATYAALFTELSTTWGIGDGSTTFNVPNLNGRVTLGNGAGTMAETVAAASVSTAGDTFTVGSNTDKWITGMPVILTTTGTLPAGLSLATTYYLVRTAATTIQFATTLANAQNSVIIDLTTQGTGNHTLTYTLTARTLGASGGEEAHAMSLTELLAHTHGIDSNALATAGAATYGTGAFSTVVSASRGGNAAMNIVSPYAVVKKIIKT